MNLSQSTKTNLKFLSSTVFLLFVLFSATITKAQTCPPTSNVSYTFDWTTNQMNVTWDVVPGAASYEVLITSNAGPAFTSNPITNTTTATLPAGTGFGDISIIANCGSEQSDETIIPYFLIVATVGDLDLPPISATTVYIPAKFCAHLGNNYSVYPQTETIIHVTAHPSIACLPEEDYFWYGGSRAEAQLVNSEVCSEDSPWFLIDCPVPMEVGSNGGGGDEKGRLNKNLAAPMKAYPNPNNGNLMLDFSIQKESDVSINMLDPTGKRVKQLIPMQSFQIGQYLESYSIEDLDAGFYLIELHIDDTTQLIKLIKL